MKINNPPHLFTLPYNRFLFLVLSFVCLQVVSVNASHAPDTVFNHQQEAILTTGQPVPVSVLVTNTTGIISARCYIRYDTASDFVYFDLVPGQEDFFSGTVPAAAENVTELEYFFLVINAKKQVVRSSLYTLGSTELAEVRTRSVTAGQSPLLYTELSELAEDVHGSFMDPDITIIQVAEKDRYGLAAGVYPPDRFSNAAVTEGYFGGFALNPDGEIQPVQGLVLDIEKNNPSVQRLDSMFVTPDPLLQEEETTDIVGPDIRGDDWSGLFWMQDSQGNRYFPTPISAVITQTGSEITITYTFLSPPPIVIGEYYWGSINPIGSIQVYDEYFETWTSYFGPATETSVTIADFVGDVDDPKADLYVFELTRDPAPPPPPEPAPVSFLPAIYKILFP